MQEFCAQNNKNAKEKKSYTFYSIANMDQWHLISSLKEALNKICTVCYTSIKLNYLLYLTSLDNLFKFCDFALWNTAQGIL